ncbi:tRNA1(Val) (adenine(37)-N6)-methyltransferase [Deltaproteobacteria bacterium IMCC39524]|nr:tRNA1(Val) (adenine(37)-N6)-methyltransferase [Deltaproteobacteria bacterium IMCC39524]
MTTPVANDETLDELIATGFKVLQAKKGYRYSLDPVLLCAFISSVKNSRVVDLGTGNGVIPFLLSSRKEAVSIIGVELQRQMIERARRSVELNGLGESIQLVHADIRELDEVLSAGSCDVVTANPPYRVESSGRNAENGERCIARHERYGGLRDFLRAAAFLLTSGGRFYVVYLAERLPELLAEMRGSKIEPKRLRLVQSRIDEPARMVLVEGRKNGNPGMRVEPSLVIYKGEGRVYSDEVLAMYRPTVAVITNQQPASRPQP